MFWVYNERRKSTFRISLHVSCSKKSRGMAMSRIAIAYRKKVQRISRKPFPAKQDVILSSSCNSLATITDNPASLESMDVPKAED
jgi:hypothetical protein